LPAADHSHKSKYTGEEKREIKSLSESDIAELEAGKGWGLALSIWAAMVCRLCRIRHKRHHADYRIMPTPFDNFSHLTVISVFLFSLPLVYSA
jgi:hypothetical protein